MEMRWLKLGDVQRAYAAEEANLAGTKTRQKGMQRVGELRFKPVPPANSNLDAVTQRQMRAVLPPPPPPPTFKHSLLSAEGAMVADQATLDHSLARAKVPLHARLLHAATWCAAIALGGMAAYFSVTGMARIFTGAALAVTIMASAIEAGKFLGAAWVSRNYRPSMGIFTVILLVAAAEVISCVGVFGQLSAAHLDPHVEASGLVDTKAAIYAAKIEAKQAQIDDFTMQISQVDAAIKADIQRGKTTAALDHSRQQEAVRQHMVSDRNAAEIEFVELKGQAAAVSAEQQRANADIGVLEYAASLFGVKRERMIQWLILAMVLTCDPLSIALVVATSQREKA